MTALFADALPEQQTTTPHKWLVATSVMLGSVLTNLDASIVNVALPSMQKSFGVGVDQITWVVTSYLVAVSVMLPMAGWTAARVGRKRYFVISVVLFVMASAFCGLASGINQLVVFRIIQGAAGAAMMPLSQAILLETFPPEEHTLAMTTFGMGMMVAPVFGPTLGGWLTVNWSWRWNFYINVPMGAIAAVMVYSFVHDPVYLRTQRGKGRVDYIGIVLIALALGLFQIVLGRGGLAGWFAAPWVRYLSAASALSAVLLVVHELRFPEPILDLRILKIFGFTLSVVLLSVQALALFSINLLNPLFLETVLSYDAWKAGLAVAPRGLGVIIALIAVGQLSRRGFDMRRFVAAGFILAGYEVWQMSRWGLDVSMPAVLVPIFLFGMGLGAVFPTITAMGIGQIKRERMGFAASLFGMVVSAGAATGIGLVTNALTARYQFHRASQYAHFSLLNASKGLGMSTTLAGSHAWLLAYDDVYRVLAILLLFLAPWCLLLKRSGDGKTQALVE
jgi:MFS transporter, DHA2 family, multidrug resistance protein